MAARISLPRTLSATLAILACYVSAGAGAQSATRDALVDELRLLHRIDLLPKFRAGTVVAQESSYDRTGGNDDGFAGTYSSLRREGDHLVVAEFQGPGVVQRIWTPTPTDSPIAFYFDGETSPRLRLPFIDLFSGKVEPFVTPLVSNEVGGYTSYVPLPYARSLKIVYENTDLRFHQIQYRRFAPDDAIASLTLPLSPEARAQVERIAALWNDPGKRPWDDTTQTSEHEFSLGPEQEFELFADNHGGRILGIEIERPPGVSSWGRDVWLHATWDGQAQPAILGPVDDLFGHAFGRPSARSLLFGSRGERDYLYLPMPYSRSARLVLRTGLEAIPVRGRARVFHVSAPQSADEGYLRAVWHRESPAAEGQPYLLAEAAGRGHLVATLLQAQGLRPGMTAFFEGDDRAVIDGELRLHGTGSEDYFNGGWYALLDRWDGPLSLPLSGALEYNLPLSRTGGYRVYLGDKLSFERSLQLSIEHGPEGNTEPVDYTSVAYLYGDPLTAAPLTPTSAPSTAPLPPARHEFFPQLLQVSLGFRTTVDTEHRPYLQVASAGEGLLRIDLSAVPVGRYRVLLSYERGPEGAEFSLWRRQQPITDWLDSWAVEVAHQPEQAVGEIVLNNQVRTLTIRTRAREGRTVFRFDRLILERLTTSAEEPR